jgi:ribosome biogenesis GTPase
VVDTPGLRAFGLWDVTVADVVAGFREIAATSPDCKFRDCAHRSEPECAVRVAVEAGEIDEERFDSFLRLKDEVAARAAERQSSRRR